MMGIDFGLRSIPSMGWTWRSRMGGTGPACMKGSDTWGGIGREGQNAWVLLGIQGGSGWKGETGSDLLAEGVVTAFGKGFDRVDCKGLSAILGLAGRVCVLELDVRGMAITWAESMVRASPCLRQGCGD